MYLPHPPTQTSTFGVALHGGNLGQASWKKAGESSVNAAKAYLDSNGDVLAIFEEAFGFLSTAAIKLPPPWNAIAGVASYLAGSLVTTIRKFLERTALHVGRYCTVNVTAAVVRSMRDSWLTWCYDAAKDKLVQAANQKTWLRIAIEGANLAIPDDDELNLKFSGRTASRVYTTAVKNGANPSDAATAAFYVAKDSGASIGTLNKWAKKAGAQTSWQMSQPSTVWRKRTEGQRVNASQVNRGTISSGPSNAILYGAAAGLLLLLVASRRR